ncbi:MAG: hypothetical protein AAF624_09530 [Bacteroidota bacterium]
MRRFSWTSSALLALLAFGLAACDSSDPGLTDAPVGPPDPGTFSAAVATPDGALQIAGTAQASASADAFLGTFESYPIATEDETTYTFSVFQLAAASGEELILGYISDGDALASGTYNVEFGRNLTPPYDFVGVFDGDALAGRGGSALVARGGSVELTVEDGLIGGTFSLDLGDGTSVSGQFATPTL